MTTPHALTVLRGCDLHDLSRVSIERCAEHPGRALALVTRVACARDDLASAATSALLRAESGDLVAVCGIDSRCRDLVQAMSEALGRGVHIVLATSIRDRLDGLPRPSRTVTVLSTNAERIETP